jgi:hypothetical protein
VGDLAVQVGRLDDVAIHDAQGAYPRPGDVCRCRTAEPPCADDEDLGSLEPLLACVCGCSVSENGMA